MVHTLLIETSPKLITGGVILPPVPGEPVCVPWLSIDARCVLVTLAGPTQYLPRAFLMILSLPVSCCSVVSDALHVRQLECEQVNIENLPVGILLVFLRRSGIHLILLIPVLLRGRLIGVDCDFFEVERGCGLSQVGQAESF